MNDNSLKDFCKILSLPVVYSTYEKEAENAARLKIPYQDYLFKVLENQILIRVDNSINAKIKKAKFPFIKTLEQFDFSFQPQMDEKLIRELAKLSFLKDGKNILFIGPPGVGKTHLAVGFGVNCAKNRKRVLFYTAEELILELKNHELSKDIAAFIESISRVDLLIIDELGYITMDKQSASLFFKLISKRYEKTSTIITSNKPFEEWDDIFNDEVIAAAILDRLLHHSHPFLIQGKSFRTKEIFGNRDNKNEKL